MTSVGWEKQNITLKVTKMPPTAEGYCRIRRDSLWLQTARITQVMLSTAEMHSTMHYHAHCLYRTYNIQYDPEAHGSQVRKSSSVTQQRGSDTTVVAWKVSQLAGTCALYAALATEGCSSASIRTSVF